MTDQDDGPEEKLLEGYIEPWRLENYAAHKNLQKELEVDFQDKEMEKHDSGQCLIWMQVRRETRTTREPTGFDQGERVRRAQPGNDRRGRSQNFDCCLGG